MSAWCSQNAQLHRTSSTANPQPFQGHKWAHLIYKALPFTQSSADFLPFGKCIRIAFKSKYHEMDNA